MRRLVVPTPLPGAPAHGLASPSSRFSEQQEHPALSQNCFPVHCYASTFHLQHFSGLIFPTLQKRKCTSCSSSYKDSSHGVVLKCLIEQTSYSLGFLQGFLAWVVESVKYWQIIRGELLLHHGATHSVTTNRSDGANHRAATLWRVTDTPTLCRKQEELGSSRHHLCPTRWSLPNKQECENLRLR